MSRQPILIAVGLLALVCVIHPFPTQDGPSHIENARLLGNYLFRGEIQPHLEFQPKLFQNWPSHLIGAMLLELLPPPIVDAILCLFCLLFLLFEIYKLLPRQHPAQAFVILPLLFPFFFWKGFYNFHLGTALLLFCLRAAFEQSTFLKLPLALSISIFVHPISGAFALVSSGAILAMKGSLHWRNVKKLLLVIVPSFGFIAVALWVHSGARLSVAYLADLPSRLTYLLSGDALVGLSPKSIYFTSAYTSALLFLVLCILMFHQAAGKREPLMAALVSCFVLYLLIPDQYSEVSYIAERTAFFPILLSALVVLRSEFFFKFHSLLSFFLTFLVLPHLCLSLVTAYRTSLDLREYRSIEHFLSEKGNVIGLWLTSSGCSQYSCLGAVYPFAHAEGYLAAEKNLRNFTNYEPREGHFQFRYKQSITPFSTLFPRPHGLELGTPQVNLTLWEEQTKLPIDYIILWSKSPLDSTTFQEVFTPSSSLGLFDQCYKRTGATSRLHLYERIKTCSPSFKDESQILRPGNASLNLRWSSAPLAAVQSARIEHGTYFPP